MSEQKPTIQQAFARLEELEKKLALTPHPDNVPAGVDTSQGVELGLSDLPVRALREATLLGAPADPVEFLLEKSVTTPLLGDAAVTTEKVEDESVTLEKLAADTQWQISHARYGPDATAAPASAALEMANVVIPEHKFMMLWCTHTAFPVAQPTSPSGFVLQSPATTIGESDYPTAVNGNRQTFPSIYFAGVLNPVTDSGTWLLSRQDIQVQVNLDDNFLLQFVFFNGNITVE